MGTIPLCLPSVTSGNIQSQKPTKLGQHLRRWGTLCGKSTMPTGEEIKWFPLDMQSVLTPPPTQTVHYTSNVNIPKPPASASLTESGMFKAPLPSPPATADPGLKGFMSQFHRSRTTDMSPERDCCSMEQEHHPRPPILNPSSGTSTSPLNNYVFPRQELANHSQSALTNKLNFQSPTSSCAILPDRFHSTHHTEHLRLT
jgi:serine/arginine repetitive matrix protein 2